MPWPPTLQALKDDVNVALTDTRDDARLQTVLTAAVVVVQRLREGDLNFTADPLSTLPAPGADVELGTIRLASRWHTRRRSPDALVQLAELGSGRVPMFDADVEMLLQVGRHHVPVVAVHVPTVTG